jgi:rhodanese-related sulfurtransferase
MKRIIMAAFILLITATAWSAGYNYVSQEQVKTWIETQSPVIIVDIQVREEFDVHHLKGSLATYAYPAKSDLDKAKLDTAVSQAKSNNHPVVIVCPRGKGGAKRSYDYMAAHDVAKDRLLILEKGMAGWSYKGLVEKN